MEHRLSLPLALESEILPLALKSEILSLTLESEFLPDISSWESDRSRTGGCRRPGRSGRSHRARRSQGIRTIVSSSGGESPRPWRSHVRLSVGVRGDSLIRHSGLDLISHGLYGAPHLHELVEIIALVSSLVP